MNAWLNDYPFRFYDDKEHPNGTMMIVTALDLEQAFLFADMIAGKLVKVWESNVRYEVYPK